MPLEARVPESVAADPGPKKANARIAHGSATCYRLNRVRTVARRQNIQRVRYDE
jgi:hypothetical protein